MPKISEAGGPTDENQPGYYEKGRSFQSPNVVETDPELEQADGEGDDVSAGNSSLTSDESRERNEKTESDSDRSSAPATAGPSKKAPVGRFGARSTAGPGKGRDAR